jgi:hypothetical protein
MIQGERGRIVKERFDALCGYLRHLKSDRLGFAAVVLVDFTTFLGASAFNLEHEQWRWMGSRKAERTNICIELTEYPDL